MVAPRAKGRGYPVQIQTCVMKRNLVTMGFSPWSLAQARFDHGSDFTEIHLACVF